MKVGVHVAQILLLSLFVVHCTDAESSEGAGGDDDGGSNGSPSGGSGAAQAGATGSGGAGAGGASGNGGSSSGGTSSGGTGASSGGSGGLSCDDPPRIPSTTVGAAPVPESQFTAQYPTAACAAMQTCCAKSAVPFDQTGCQAFALAALDTSKSYDANAAGACLADLAQSVDCNGDLSFQGIPGQCSLVYRGALPLGAVCEDASDCAPDARGLVDCEYSASLADTICFVDVRGKPGDACNESCNETPSGAECFPLSDPVDPAVRVTCHREDGLTCTSSGCAPPAPVGCACILGLDYCNLESTCSSSDGVCVGRAPAGAACVLDDQCSDGLQCADDDTCTQEKSHGAACASHRECAGYCFGGVCQPDSGAVRLTFDDGYCG